MKRRGSSRRGAGAMLPRGVRALLPVLGANGGVGRSALAGLLAQVLAPTTRTVLVDTVPRGASPWADWLGLGVTGGAVRDVSRDEAVGLPAALVPPGRPLDPDAVRDAALRRSVPVRRRRRGDDLPDLGADAADGPGYDVLTDARPWTRPPVAVPEDPRWYAHLLETGGWFAGVVDTSTPVALAHVAARNAVRPSALDEWSRRPDAVPVLVTSASGFGAAALARLVQVLEHDGLAVDRMVAAVVDVAGTDPPRWMDGELAPVRDRLAAVVRVPHDKAIRADGLARLGDLAPGTLAAAQEIVTRAAELVRPVPAAEAPGGLGGPGGLGRPAAPASSGRPPAPPVRHRGPESPDAQQSGWVPRR
ncbi:hypothetical protein ABZV93_05520 [Actinopolymorpha sp. NPDC004070]|uniref:hypothetical protein n=1 Tax=Actinopolymorpha sp. NPDC004070 TaxID=3154548 RepID=UPI0033AC26C6